MRQAQGCFQCYGNWVPFGCPQEVMVKHSPFRQKELILERNPLDKKKKKMVEKSK